MDCAWRLLDGSVSGCVALCGVDVDGVENSFEFLQDGLVVHFFDAVHGAVARGVPGLKIPGF